MGTLKLVWTRLAIEDLDDAYNYIAATNPGASVDIIERIAKAVAALRLTPNMGFAGRLSGTRELVVTRTPFIVPYRVTEERALVSSVECRL